MMAEMPLYELRRAQQFSQQNLAERLNMKQAAVSKMERRTDMYISTLRSYIEAMGGTLNITAKFPEGDVQIKLFSNEADSEADAQVSIGHTAQI